MVGGSILAEMSLFHTFSPSSVLGGKCRATCIFTAFENTYVLNGLLCYQVMKQLLFCRKPYRRGKFLELQRMQKAKDSKPEN